MNRLEGALVVSFSLDTWEGSRMSRHQVMSRLARTNHVLFVGRPGSMRRSAASHCQLENLEIYEFPWWLGRVRGPRWLRDLLQAARISDIRHTIVRLQQFRPVLIYIWHPSFWQYATVFEPAVVCYHMYDDYESYLGLQGVRKKETLKEQEEFLLQRADVCFAVTTELAAKKGLFRPVIPMANGVEYEVFERATLSSTPVAPELLPLRKPLIGYIGTLGSKVDFSLLVDICQDRPEWSLVMIGPTTEGATAQPAYRELQALPNAFFMGAQRYESLPGWLKGIDVCLMPYRRDSHMRYGYPLKMLEYFTAGKPVVSMDIPAVNPYTHVLKIAATSVEWIAQIESSLREDTQVQRDTRQRIAGSNTWDSRVDEISRHLLMKLHERNLLDGPGNP